MFTQAVQDKIAARAKLLMVEPEAILAVAEVESAGVPFWNVNGVELPPVRFEGHYFYRLLKARPAKLSAAVAAGLASPKAGAIANPNSYSARYDLVARACAIDEEAALASCSWGLGQVMGEHAVKLGFANVAALVAMAKSGVDGQIEVMVRYINAFGLADELRDHGWRKFADQYNGPASERNGYAGKLAAAYQRYKLGARLPNSGNDVAAVQKSLAILGYYKGTADGLNGPQTVEAVREFQTSQGLVADGDAGQMTKEAIDRELAKRRSGHGTKIATAGAVGTSLSAVGSIVSEQAQALQGLGDLGPAVTYMAVAFGVFGMLAMVAGVVMKAKAGT